MITKGKMQSSSVFIWFLSLYLFLMPLDFLPVVPGVSLSRFLIVLPVLGMLVEIRKFKRIRYASLPVLLYLTAAFISMLFTVNFNSSIDRFITLLLNVGIILLFSAREYTKKELDQLIRAAAWSGWFLLGLSVLYSDFATVDGRMTIIVNGQAQDPNYLCGFFILPICYYLWKFVVDKKWRSIIPVGAFMIVMLLTGSRGGLIAAMIASVIMVLKSAVYSRKTLAKIFAIAIILMVVLYFLWDYIPTVITDRFTIEYTVNDSAANRFDIWKDLWGRFTNSGIFRQIFGYGTATVREHSAFDHVAHNVYLESLIETGVIGLIFVLIMYMYYVKKAWKLSVGYIAPVLVGYLALAFSLSLYSYKPIWNIILFIVIIPLVKVQGSRGTDVSQNANDI